MLLLKFICCFYTLQDYEYASYNPVAFDLANHFCEMAANYHTETPHVLDYSLYPGKQFSVYSRCLVASIFIFSPFLLRKVTMHCIFAAH